mgnify:CR=1 FL=1
MLAGLSARPVLAGRAADPRTGAVSEPPGPHTSLEFYPWIIVRFRCTKCRRYGDARLAKLAEKFGAGETIEELIVRFHATCPGRTPRSARSIQRPCRCPDDARRVRGLDDGAMGAGESAAAAVGGWIASGDRSGNEAGRGALSQT